MSAQQSPQESNMNTRQRFIFTITIVLSTLIFKGCGVTKDDTKTVIEPVPPIMDENIEKFTDGSRFIFEKDIRIQMRDGVTLSANVFRPILAGKYPVIMAMTPYNKDWLDVQYDEIEGEINVSKFATFEQADPEFWVSNDYVVIAIDNRGMSLSEGDMALLSATEAEDYYDAIQWAGKQPWSNGNIGLNGVSYMAMNQWKVAELAPPHLKAIMPWEGLTDLYRDFAYHGGIGGNSFLAGWWQFRILENKNATSAVQNLFTAVQETPFTDELYDAHSPVNLSSINIPAYVVASWPDHGLHTRGTLAGFEQINSQHKWLEIHGRKKWEWYYSKEAQQRQLAFFDHFLADRNEQILAQPRVTYEARTSYYQGETKTADQWPLLLQEQTTLFLDSSSGQLLEQNIANDASASYAARAGSEEQPLTSENKIIFSHTFNQTTEITGSMKLELWLSLKNAQDTDLFVGIQKHDSQGNVVYFHGNDVINGQVANGWLRASHRELDENKSTFTRPFHLHQRALPIDEDEIVKVEVELHPSSTIFESGEKLTVLIQGGDIEESGLEHDSISQGTVTIHTGSLYPSKLNFNKI